MALQKLVRILKKKKKKKKKKKIRILVLDKFQGKSPNFMKSEKVAKYL